MSKRKRRLWIFLGLLFGCPCLLAGLALTYVRIGFGRVAATLPDELAAARKAGMALEPGDLRRMMATAPNENAAPAYRQAIALREAANLKLGKDFAAARDDYLSDQAKPEQVMLLVKGLADLDDCFAAIEEGSRKPHVDWDRQWERGFDVMFPEYVSLKGLVKELGIRARLEAQRGEIDRALRDVETCFKVAGHMGAEPTLISCLVWFANEAIAFRALESVLNASPVSTADLKRASRIVESLRPLPNFKDTLGGEAVMFRQTVHRLKSLREITGSYDDWGGSEEEEPSNAPSTDPADWLLRDANYKRAWEAKYIRYVTRLYIALPTEPDVARLRLATNQYDADLEADNSLENKMNQLTSSVFSGLPDALAREIVYRRAMLAAIKVLQQRQQTGKFPSALPASGNDAIDPYSSKPLGYVMSGKGFKVYSVDRDLVDDKGLTRREDKKAKSSTHDIAFTFR